MIGRLAGVLVLTSFAATSGGCRMREPEPTPDSAASAGNEGVAFTAPDSATLRSATAALGEFLEASREGSAARDRLVRLTDCPGGAEAASGPMLATYELLRPASRADTVVGRAVVTTVAEQDVDRRHRGYFIARMRVRRDTLEWDVLPARSGGWVVCNGIRFGMTAPDSLTEWRPDGASAEAARALADSLQRATAR